MKRIFAVVLVVMLMSTLVVGCSANKSADKAEMNNTDSLAYGDVGAGVKYGTNNGTEEGAANEGKLDVGFTTESVKGKETATTALTASGSTSESASNPILAQRKVIRSANVTVEVEDFDTAYGMVKTLINGFGYVQESNIKKDGTRVSGVIVIRVDKDRFDSVISGIKELGDSIEEYIKSDDVTDKFFDTEAELRVLKYEQTRLEEYLNKITDPDTIFKTESRLTEIRHQIESLTGTLQKWADLVELSTITINLREKGAVIQDEPKKEKTYWERLSQGFKESTKGVVSFCGEALIFIIQALPVLILLALVFIAALLVYRKFLKNIKVNPSEDHNNDTQA